MNDKTSEAQKRASREWKKRNPARTKYMVINLRQKLLLDITQQKLILKSLKI